MTARGRGRLGGCAAAVALLAFAPAWAQTDGAAVPAGAEGPIQPGAGASSTAAPAAAASDATAGQPAQTQQSSDQGSGIAGGIKPPLFAWQAAVNLAEGYSSNALGGSGASYKSDFFTQGQLSLGAQYAGPRLTGNLAYVLSGDYYARFHQLNRVENRLTASGSANIITDTLFLNADAFATPLALSRVGTLSSGGGAISDQNTRDSYGYNVSPEFVLHFRDYATSTLTASQGGVFFVTPSITYPGVTAPIVPAQNTVSTSVTEQLASGTYFGRLGWSMAGSYNQTNQTTQSERQAEGVGSLSYALTRWLTLLGTGGYSEFKSSVPLTKNLNGPVGMGGAKLSYGQTFALTVEGGVQNNFTSYIGSLQWNLTPLTSVYGSATDTISTPQGSILSNLATLAPTPGGGFSDSSSNYGTPLGLSPTPQFNMLQPLDSYGLSLDNSIYRMRAGSIGLVHTEGRTDYTLSVSATERDRLTVLPGNNTQPRTSYYAATLGISHRLWPNLTGTGTVTYSYANEFGGHDRILTIDGNLTYQLSQHFSVYAAADYLNRSGTGQIGIPNVALADAQIIVGIQAGL